MVNARNDITCTLLQDNCPLIEDKYITVERTDSSDDDNTAGVAVGVTFAVITITIIIITVVIMIIWYHRLVLVVKAF